VAGTFGFGWYMIFAQSVSNINSTTAALTKGTGASLTYTNKNATTGVYTAPAEAVNKLVQNTNGTWTETQPDGLTLNYDTSGQLAAIKRAGNCWTMTYGTIMFGQPFSNHITDPANRRATFLYTSTGIGVPPYTLRRFTDVVGRITTFTYFTGTLGAFLRRIQTPDQALTTIAYNPSSYGMSLWEDPLGNRTTYSYNGTKLAAVTDPTGHLTQFGYLLGQTPGQTFTDPRSFVTTYSYNVSNQPNSVLDPLGQRSTLLWTSGQLMTAIDTAGNRTSLTYATMSDGRKFVSTLQTPQGACYTWLYDTSDRVRATVDPLGHRNSFVWDANNNRTAQIDQLGNITSFLYTSGGQLRATINPLSQRTTALFDATSRVKTIVDPLGHRTTFTYTALTAGAGHKPEQLRYNNALRQPQPCSGCHRSL
jgi:YD repeat-containing protein